MSAYLSLSMIIRVNNIPELHFRPQIQHQFRTLETTDEQNKTDILYQEMSGSVLVPLLVTR